MTKASRKKLARALSFMLVLTMVFSFFPLSTNAKAASVSKKEIKVHDLIPGWIDISEGIRSVEAVMTDEDGGEWTADLVRQGNSPHMHGELNGPALSTNKPYTLVVIVTRNDGSSYEITDFGKQSAKGNDKNSTVNFWAGEPREPVVPTIKFTKIATSEGSATGTFYFLLTCETEDVSFEPRIIACAVGQTKIISDLDELADCSATLKLRELNPNDDDDVAILAAEELAYTLDDLDNWTFDDGYILFTIVDGDMTGWEKYGGNTVDSNYATFDNPYETTPPTPSPSPSESPEPETPEIDIYKTSYGNTGTFSFTVVKYLFQTEDSAGIPLAPFTITTLRPGERESQSIPVTEGYYLIYESELAARWPGWTLSPYAYIVKVELYEGEYSIDIYRFPTLIAAEAAIEYGFDFETATQVNEITFINTHNVITTRESLPPVSFPPVSEPPTESEPPEDFPSAPPDETPEPSEPPLSRGDEDPKEDIPDNEDEGENNTPLAPPDEDVDIPDLPLAGGFAVGILGIIGAGMAGAGLAIGGKKKEKK